MGRMVYDFTARAKLVGVRARRFTLYFVILDIAWVIPACHRNSKAEPCYRAFVIQVVGAASATGQDTPVSQVRRGEMTPWCGQRRKTDDL